MHGFQTEKAPNVQKLFDNLLAERNLARLGQACSGGEAGWLDDAVP